MKTKQVNCPKQKVGNVISHIAGLNVCTFFSKNDIITFKLIGCHCHAHSIVTVEK